MKGTVHYETQGGIAVLSIDNPPVNALSSGVRQGLWDGIGRALGEEGVGAIVVVGKGRTFPAGADISEIGDPSAQGCPLGEVLARMDGSAKPLVAALHGTAFGGGLETALCCDYRVATADARLGLPEVKLGLLPGAGGTQRLPRLVGVEAALRMMLSGDPVTGAEAEELGLVDAKVEGELLGAALAFARELLSRGAPTRKVREQHERLDRDRGRPELLEEARAWAGRRRRGENAPERIVQCVEAALGAESFDEGLARERELFLECVGDPQSGALRHVFFAERQAAKIPDLPKDTPAREVKGAAVVGGGTMGRGIAMTFANAGIDVKLLDVDEGALEAALAAVRKTYESSVGKGRITREEADARLGRITGTTRWEDLADADFAVEAVFEELELKQEVFGKLGELLGAEAILATNTSTLDVDAIAKASGRPEQVVGTHFFSPAHVMKLLEVVRGADSGPTALQTAMKLGKRLGKVAVLAGNCDGFIGNRMLHQYVREAAFLLEEGALPSQVDRALTNFGLAMGPFAMGDLAGLDVGWRIRKRRGRPQGVRYSPLADRLCEQGRFGQKTGAGWYRYEEGSRTPTPDPDVEKLIVDTAKELGIERREIDDEEIVERCMYPLVNEGAKILEEGIALRASDIDVVYVYGYGFPAWRGGPMYWAEQIGLAEVHAAIERYHAEHGACWKPAPLLTRRAEQGGTFD